MGGTVKSILLFSLAISAFSWHMSKTCFPLLFSLCKCSNFATSFKLLSLATILPLLLFYKIAIFYCKVKTRSKLIHSRIGSKSHFNIGNHICGFTIEMDGIVKLIDGMYVSNRLGRKRLFVILFITESNL